MKRVLLINLDRIEHVNPILRDKGIKLSVVTTKPNSHLYKDSQVGIVKDLINASQVHAAALRLSGPDRFDYVVTPLERAQLPAGLVRSNLGIHGLTYEQTLGFANKFIMKERIRQAGIPVTRYSLAPRVSMIPEAAAKTGWPVILKPVVGSGAQYTYRLDSAEHARSLIHQDKDLRMLARRGVPMIVERALDVSAEYHCDGVVYRGETIFASISRYIRPLFDCVGSFAGSYILKDGDPIISPIRDMHARVVDVLGLENGVTHFEAFLTPDGLIFGEIACRPGGSGVASNIARKYRINLWDTFINLQIGLGPGPCDPAPPDESIIGWLGVPVRNGRVLEIAQPEDFSIIPGVRGTKMLYQVGDYINERRATGSLAAYVYFIARSTDEVDSIVAEISEKYYIRTDPRD